jgi:hypothetical protein
MNPAAILALVSAVMPLLQELLTFGVSIAQSAQAAQGTPAAAPLAQLQAAHAALVSKSLTSLVGAIGPH